MRRIALFIVSVAVGALALGAATGWRTIAANGVKVTVPSGWQRVKPADAGSVIDPRTVLVVGTSGVRPRSSRCQIAAYRIPPDGAVIVVVRWRSQESSGGRSPRSREPLRKIVIRRPSFECFSGRGGVAQLTLGGHPYQVNVMVGDAASTRRIRETLAVARSFDLARR
jgi:hypothetical protein